MKGEIVLRSSLQKRLSITWREVTRCAFWAAVKHKMGLLGGCERKLTCGLANKHTVNFMKGSLFSKYLKREEFRKNTVTL